MWKSELTLLRKENEAQVLKLHGEDVEVIISIAKYLGVPLLILEFIYQKYVRV